jgi:hypothetical protein
MLEPVCAELDVDKFVASGNKDMASANNPESAAVMRIRAFHFMYMASLKVSVGKLASYSIS